MRVEELLRRDLEADRSRRYALEPRQHAFVHVVPSETGLSRTIWVSQSEKYPALLVSPHTGRASNPPRDVVAVGLDEDTPFAEVNAWLRNNRHLLKPLAAQDIDIGHLYDEMTPLGKRAFTAMVNLPRRITALPMVVWCSPRNARHDVRVKVSPVHGDRMPEDDAIIIAVRPAPHYPRSERRRLTQEDFRLVSACPILTCLRPTRMTGRHDAIAGF